MRQNINQYAKENTFNALMDKSNGLDSWDNYIGATTVLRRDYDGISQADWLVEKMIGEVLISGSTSELPKG